MKRGISIFFPVFLLIALTPVKAQDDEWSQAERFKAELNIDKLILTHDNNNHVIVTGFFTDYVDIAGKRLESKGSLDILIAKYDIKGQLLWYKHEGGSNIDFSRFINTDSQDNIYIQGLYRGEAQFEDVRMKSNGTWDFFTVKYDNRGQLIWVKTKKTNPFYSGKS